MNIKRKKITKQMFVAAFFATWIVFGLWSSADAGEKKLDLSLCAPGQSFTQTIDNPYILYEPIGRQWRLIGEEDGEQIIVRITVLGATETMYAGTADEVITRVVEELEALDENEDGIIQNEEVIEQSFNYYAQTVQDDIVCYFGEMVYEPVEDSENFELDEIDEPLPGVVVPGLAETEEGAWRADAFDSSPGIFFPKIAKEGTRFQQENGPPDALDEMKIIGSGSVLLENVTIDGVKLDEITFTDIRRGREFNPVDGDKGYKTFAYGVGIIIDEDFELIETGILP